MQVQEAYDVDVPLLVLLTIVGAFLLLLLVTVLVVKRKKLQLKNDIENAGAEVQL